MKGEICGVGPAIGEDLAVVVELFKEDDRETGCLHDLERLPGNQHRVRNAVRKHSVPKAGLHPIDGPCSRYSASAAGSITIKESAVRKFSMFLFSFSR